MPGSLEVPPAIAIALDAAERAGKPFDGAVGARLRHPRRDAAFRDRVVRIGARADGPVGGAAIPIGNGIITVDTDAQARERAQVGQGRQGRRCRACRACAGPPQAPGRVAPWRSGHHPRSARPTGAARRGSPRCRRSTRWTSPSTGLNEILAEFESHWIGREVEGEQYLPAEAAFFRDVVGGVVREQRKLDPLIDDALAKTWPLKRIEAILRAVLRAGAYELDHRRDVPARVVVSEYVDVAHAFVEREETGMVNAVLDQIARKLRAAEFERAG